MMTSNYVHMSVTEQLNNFICSCDSSSDLCVALGTQQNVVCLMLTELTLTDMHDMTIQGYTDLSWWHILSSSNGTLNLLQNP